jgi:hypothetical protein
MKTIGAVSMAASLLAGVLLAVQPASAARFDGRFFAGEGDGEYLELLDIAGRMHAADAEFQNLAMLYMPAWNGLVEGPTWGAWWIQNSYGTTYAALPFIQEPFVRFLENSHELWFGKMGDGKTAYVWNGKDSWVPPDGCLMDCANDTWAMHRQGDGRVAIHDWGIEFTAAGGVLQSELLLISRDRGAIARDLPRLERCAGFIESRRDPKNDLFLAGPAGNLLAPSYAGWKQPDGRYGQAYLAGLSVTYIAFLDRLAELETLAGRSAEAERYRQRRASARQGLDRLMTPEGYLIKSLDPDGTRHGVYGAARHGYFEASPNHDAICFGVVDDSQAQTIYRKLAAIPGLRPHDLIVANYPSLDDMYEAPEGLWGFGTWVNGGHWTTCEARMILAYYRVGAYDDARRAMRQILSFARQFRMDNPLVACGSAVYQPGEPINLTYDAFGAPTALIRGLFEYRYTAQGLTLGPHLPSGVDRIEQKFPVRLGAKRLYLAMSGHGPITAVSVNGQPWTAFDARSVTLSFDAVPELAAIQILAGGAPPRPFVAPKPDYALSVLPDPARWAPPQPPVVVAATDLPLRLGADSNGGSRFDGEMARACIFKRALSAEEVAALSQPTEGPLFKDLALVAQWRFAPAPDGTYTNAAGSAPAARAVGKVEPVGSPFGPAVRFAGNGYLEVANAPAFALLRGGTWYALVRPGTTKGRLIDKCPVGGATGFTFDTYPGNALRLITDSGAVSADPKLEPGRWVHLAATVDTNGSSVLYVDGKRVAAAPRAASAYDLKALLVKVDRVRRFHQSMVEAGLGDAYEAAHARLAVQCLLAAHERQQRLAAGTLSALPPRSAAAADRLYLETASKLCDGLAKVLDGYANVADAGKRRTHGLWRAAGGS